jgi:hypothetical protein
MTAYEGLELQIHSFVNKALDRGGSSVSRTDLLNLSDKVLGSFLVPTELEPGWIQHRSGTFREDKVFFLQGFEP